MNQRQRAQWLLQQLPLPQQPRLVVLAGEGARAFPGDPPRIELGQGLLEQLGDRQVSALLAHELWHACYEDEARLARWALAVWLSVGLALALTLTLGWVWGLAALLLHLAARLRHARWCRQGELQADRWAAQHTDPQALLELLEPEQSPGRWPPLILRTHPSPQQRRAQLQQLASATSSAKLEE